MFQNPPQVIRNWEQANQGPELEHALKDQIPELSKRKTQKLTNLQDNTNPELKWNSRKTQKNNTSRDAREPEEIEHENWLLLNWNQKSRINYNPKKTEFLLKSN